MVIMQKIVDEYLFRVPFKLYVTGKAQHSSLSYYLVFRLTNRYLQFIMSYKFVGWIRFIYYYQTSNIYTLINSL